MAAIGCIIASAEREALPVRSNLLLSVAFWAVWFALVAVVMIEGPSATALVLLFGGLCGYLWASSHLFFPGWPGRRHHRH